MPHFRIPSLTLLVVLTLTGLTSAPAIAATATKAKADPQAVA